MFAIIGIVIVLVGIIGGYLMEDGNLSLLFQPAELVIIGGAAFGSFVIASPRRVLFSSLKKFAMVFSGKEATKAVFLDLLILLFDMLVIARREGLLVLDDHVNAPAKSPIFKKHPNVLANHEVTDFICDNLKLIISGSIETHEFDNIMDVDIEARHLEETVPAASINKLADSLPGLGIVAAVLGVVITMGKINEPPEVLGHSVGAALVGTFLGILACYGFMGPMATNLEHQAQDSETLLKVVKSALIASTSGMPPSLAVESARRAIPTEARPSFEELEKAMKGGRK